MGSEEIGVREEMNLDFWVFSSDKKITEMRKKRFMLT